MKRLGLLTAILLTPFDASVAIPLSFYYVSGQPDEHGMWRALQNPDGSWDRGDPVLLDGAFDCDAVDPDAVRLWTGLVRLYYFDGFSCTPPDPSVTNTIRVAESIFASITDAFAPRRFRQRATPAFVYPGVTDPSVVNVGSNRWLMATARHTGSGTDIVLAGSGDGGYTFSYEQTLSPGGIPELAKLDDGSLRLYYNGTGGIVSRRSTDGGLTWTNEAGARLADSAFVADPSVVRASATSWYLFVKTLTNSVGPDTGPASHMVKLAHGTSPDSFSYIDTNVLRMASVPDGIHVRTSLLFRPIPIHMHIVIHTEQITPYHIPSVFEEFRTNLYKFALMVKSHNAMLNFQSDWNFLAAVTNYDHLGRPETGGTNIVAWLKYHMGFEIDPHNHIGESAYNYADVAALIASCGVTPSPIVGGFRAAPLHESEYDLFMAPITGAVYTGFVWKAGVLWGAASPGHVNETNLWFSGIYSPRSAAALWSHQDGNMPMIGGMAGGDTSRTNLPRLLALRDAGKLCPDKIYTAHISVRAGDINDAYIAELNDYIANYTNVPGVRWVGQMQTMHIWREEYGEQPSYLPFAPITDLDQDGIADQWEAERLCTILFNEAQGDLDFDGHSLREEYIADTDPKTGLSRPPRLRGDHASIIIEATSSAREYSIEYASNLVNATWLLWTNRMGVGGTLSVPHPPVEANRPAFVRHLIRLP